LIGKKKRDVCLVDRGLFSRMLDLGFGEKSLNAWRRTKGERKGRKRIASV
tara:strand:- start:948 stop:1097 length:150 start_codon:yes stop_codon:yes gene_type:complete